MYRRFVPTEFNAFHMLSWLSQFKSAMRIRKLYPRDALNALLDMDLERWQSICDNIPNIELVADAAEFLGDWEPDTEDLHRRITLTIKVIKLAAFRKRSARLFASLKELAAELKELGGTAEYLQSQINGWAYEMRQFNKGEKTYDADRMAEVQKFLVDNGEELSRVRERIETVEKNVNIKRRTLQTLSPI